MDPEENYLIKLCVSNGKVLTFNPDDYLKIRSKYHIMGKLIGIPVCNARNMHINGLPAFFNEYEVKLLVEQKLVILENKTGLKESPSIDVKRLYEDHLKNVIDELYNPYIETRLNTTRINMDNIIRGKTKKLIKSGIPESEIVINPDDIIKDEMTKISQSMNSKGVHVQIPTQHPFEVTSSIVTDVTIENVRKYKVFKDLWNKGFFITTGDSFGCDFLTYPGDPVNFHASQIVNIVDPNKQFDIKFLASCARLSVSVKKKCVFAYTNDDDAVTYQTLQWDNPKLKKLYPLQPESNQDQVNEESHDTS